MLVVDLHRFKGWLYGKTYLTLNEDALFSLFRFDALELTLEPSACTACSHFSYMMFAFDLFGFSAHYCTRDLYNYIVI